MMKISKFKEGKTILVLIVCLLLNIAVLTILINNNEEERTRDSFSFTGTLENVVTGERVTITVTCLENGFNTEFHNNVTTERRLELYEFYSNWCMREMN